MFSKPETSARVWPKAVVSSEEIAALLHGIFPLNASLPNTNQDGETDLEAPSLSSAAEPCQPPSEISLGSLF